LEACLSALALVAVTAVLVVLSHPPGVIVAIVAVVVGGVLLSVFVPSESLGRARRRRVANRDAAHRPQAMTTDPADCTDAIAAAQES
jgi:hypothetical protein